MHYAACAEGPCSKSEHLRACLYWSTSTQVLKLCAHMQLLGGLLKTLSTMPVGNAGRRIASAPAPLLVQVQAGALARARHRVAALHDAQARVAVAQQAQHLRARSRHQLSHAIGRTLRSSLSTAHEQEVQYAAQQPIGNPGAGLRGLISGMPASWWWPGTCARTAGTRAAAGAATTPSPRRTAAGPRARPPAQTAAPPACARAAQASWGYPCAVSIKQVTSFTHVVSLSEQCHTEQPRPPTLSCGAPAPCVRHARQPAHVSTD